MFRVGIDVGGTFTDLVAVDVASGETYALKVPSTSHAPELGVADALDALTIRCGAIEIEYLAHSTTIATNALLGQLGLELPRIAFVTTAGFRDVIEIGRQNRSEIYNLFVERPRPLVARDDRFSVRERIGPAGEVMLRVSDEDVAAAVGSLAERNVQAVAIGFLHSYANDVHERYVEAAIRAALPSLHVTRSSEIAREYREYERFSTAVVNAALMPIVGAYLSRLATLVRDRGIAAPIYVMQSNGGATTLERAARLPASLIESGPASGVVATARLAKTLDLPNLLAFDMGGTTAKAGVVRDGEIAVVHEFEAAGTTHSGRATKGSGYPVRFPFVDLAEVSAGGGTIARVDALTRALHVGPLSAGADPGPACYGKSDLPTVTDASVVLGVLNPTHLAGGTFPIDSNRASAAIARLADEFGESETRTAQGIVEIIDAQMSRVLRIVTMERGLDPRDFVLVAFGGNGPLHACALARELGIDRIVVPQHPGVFSAEGLVLADLRAEFTEPILRKLDASALGTIEEIVNQLSERARCELVEQGARAADVRTAVRYDARYCGQGYEIDLEHSTSGAATLSERFHQLHRARYGYSVDDETIELVNVRLRATAPIASHARRAPVARSDRTTPLQKRSVTIGEERTAVRVYQRANLRVDERIDGPALIEQADSVTYVAPGWQAVVAPPILDLRYGGRA